MDNDLLEYARTELGGRMPVCTSLGDLRDICQTAADDEAAVAHPDCEFQLKWAGETIGDFDGPRLSQVFSNLLNNAAQYRSGQRPVTIEAMGDKTEWKVTVTNFGREISPQALRTIFDPLVQLSVSSDQKGPPRLAWGWACLSLVKSQSHMADRSALPPTTRAELCLRYGCRDHSIPATGKNQHPRNRAFPWLDVYDLRHI